CSIINTASRYRRTTAGCPTSAITRRDFLRLGLGTFGFLSTTALATADERMKTVSHFLGEDVFTRIVDKARTEKWSPLPIGELIGKIALELNGIPYVGFTLEESKDAEYCVVNLKGLDCVTFFEDSLCMARMLKKGKSSAEDLLAEVQH